MVADTKKEPGELPPPYVSWQTFTSLIEKMEKEGPPPKIDRSYLVGMSGGYQTQVMTALRSLGLIDEEGHIGNRLARMATHPDERQTLVREVFEERYPEAVKLGVERATQGQLEDAFRDRGLSADPMRKAISFFLNGAEYAGIPLSPYFKKRKQGVPAAPRKRGPRRKKRAEEREIEQRPEPMGQGSGGSVYGVKLESGGTLSLSVSVDVLRMTPRDRELVFRLADQMQEYEKDRHPDTAGGDS